MTPADRTAVGVSTKDVAEVRRQDLVVRFVFGALVSAIAAGISIALGPRAGGTMLAFPAILPATLTLIERQESKEEAEREDVGAILGAAALVVSALVGWQLVPRLPAAAALAAAGVGWLVTALVLYAAFAPLLRRDHPNVIVRRAARVGNPSHGNSP